MKSRPIIFSTEMIRAYMEGRKTQTRRVIRPQPPKLRWNTEPWDDRCINVSLNNERDYWVVSRYGQPGDSLWIRETFGLVCPDEMSGSAWYNLCNSKRPMRMHPESNIMDGIAGAIYKADGPFEFNKDYDPRGWRQSIFMPRWASRFETKIVSIRIERLQDITEADAQAEGMDLDISMDINRKGVHIEKIPDTRKLLFQYYWNVINTGRGFGWETNPWVWRIEFEPNGG